MLVKITGNTNIDDRQYIRGDIYDIPKRDYEIIKTSCAVPSNSKESQEWRKKMVKPAFAYNRMMTPKRDIRIK